MKHKNFGRFYQDLVKLEWQFLRWMDSSQLGENDKFYFISRNSSKLNTDGFLLEYWKVPKSSHWTVCDLATQRSYISRQTFLNNINTKSRNYEAKEIHIWGLAPSIGHQILMFPQECFYLFVESPVAGPLCYLRLSTSFNFGKHNYDVIEWYFLRHFWWLVRVSLASQAICINFGA